MRCRQMLGKSELMGFLNKYFIYLADCFISKLVASYVLSFAIL